MNIGLVCIRMPVLTNPVDAELVAIFFLAQSGVLFCFPPACFYGCDFPLRPNETLNARPRSPLPAACLHSLDGRHKRAIILIMKRYLPPPPNFESFNGLPIVGKLWLRWQPPCILFEGRHGQQHRGKRDERRQLCGARKRRDEEGR